MSEFAAIYHVFIFGIYFPIAVVRMRLSSKPTLAVSRRKLVVRVAITLAIFGVLSILVGADLGIELFPVWRPASMEILLTAGALAIALGSRWALLDWLRKDVPKPELNLLPSNWGELPFWIVISVLAGVAEELTYRGVLFTILKEATHSILAGACLSAAAFALAHLSQGWRATAFIFGLALLFQAMTLNSGNLYSAMIVHAVYDFVVGVLVIRERLRNPKPPGEHEGAEPGLPIK